jgi:hypothetical protein
MTSPPVADRDPAVARGREGVRATHRLGPSRGRRCASAPRFIRACATAAAPCVSLRTVEMFKHYVEFCGDWRVMAAPAPGGARPPKPPSYVKRSAGWRDCTRTVSASGAEESSLAAGHYVIKRRFQFKRAQRYIRSQLFPTTFE